MYYTNRSVEGRATSQNCDLNITTCSLATIAQHKSAYVSSKALRKTAFHKIKMQFNCVLSCSLRSTGSVQPLLYCVDFS